MEYITMNLHNMNNKLYIFIIILLSIILGIVYYVGFINNKPTNIVKESINLKEGKYIGNNMSDDNLSNTIYGDATVFNVTLKENNLCEVYEGAGYTYLGVSSIDNNKLICNTLVIHIEEGEVPLKLKNVIFEYSIESEKSIKLSKITGSDNDEYAKKIGRVYSIS